jgi:SAM-dependent methyltransferase
VSDYEQYLLSELAAFAREPGRAQASLEAVSGIEVVRVLDVGCGAGQELWPFLSVRGALAVGIDVAPEVGRVGRALAAAHSGKTPPVFLRGTAEALPFRSGSFDVVICRLALPYTDNDATVREIARVLRPGGLLLMKIHHARFYLHEMAWAIATRRWLTAVHDVRVLAAGIIYHLTGVQKRNRWLGGETFQTVGLLRRELARHGLRIQRLMPDSNSRTPSFVIEREPTAKRVELAGAPAKASATRAAGP